MGSKQQLFVPLLSIQECSMALVQSKAKWFLWTTFHSIISDLTPLLKQEEVCDRIVKAIRQNQNLLLLPKSLILSVALSRFEWNLSTKVTKLLRSFSFFLVLHRSQLNSKHMNWLAYIRQWIRLLDMQKNQHKCIYLLLLTLNPILIITFNLALRFSLCKHLCVYEQFCSSFFLRENMSEWNQTAVSKATQQFTHFDWLSSLAHRQLSIHSYVNHHLNWLTELFISLFFVCLFNKNNTMYKKILRTSNKKQPRDLPICLDSMRKIRCWGELLPHSHCCSWIGNLVFWMNFFSWTFVLKPNANDFFFEW